MAILKGKSRQTTSVERASEGADQYLRMLRDGTVGVADLIAILSLEGRVFTCNGGKATSPIAFGDGGLATTEFDFHVSVPASVCIIPLELIVTFEAFGTASLVEVCMQSGSGSAAHATNTAVTPLSSNVNTGRASACTVVCAADTGGTAFTTNIKEIYRASDQLSITTATVGQLRSPYVYTWKANNSGILDVVGPSQQIGVFAAAATGTGFITLKYAELPSETLS